MHYNGVGLLLVCVQVFDLCTGQQVDCFQAAADTVNGVDFSPCLSLLVTASGHRRYPLLPEHGWEDTAAAAPAGGTHSDAADQHQVQSSHDGSGPAKRQRVDADAGSDVYAVYSRNDVAGLSLASWQPGGLCNSLRLWKLKAQWIIAAAAGEGGVNGEEAAAVTGGADV